MTHNGSVTLVVSEWWGVAPGAVLFPCRDFESARVVARALRNAVSWFIVPGDCTLDEALDAEARGEVLLREATSSIVPASPTRMNTTLDR